jgi:hypothetical protein
MVEKSSMGIRMMVVGIAATLTILAFSTITITYAQETPLTSSQDNVTNIQNSTAMASNGEEDDKGVPEEGTGEDADEPGDVDVGDNED